MDDVVSWEDAKALRGVAQRGLPAIAVAPARDLADIVRSADLSQLAGTAPPRWVHQFKMFVTSLVRVACTCLLQC